MIEVESSSDELKRIFKEVNRENAAELFHSNDIPSELKDLKTGCLKTQTISTIAIKSYTIR